MWKQSLILRVLFIMLILILFTPISYLQSQVPECGEDPYEPPGEEQETLGSGYMINFTGTPPTWTSGPGPEICPAGDDDWFRFSVNQGDRIEVICDVITLPVADVHLYAGETLVAQKGSRYPGDAEDVMLTYTCPVTSPYYSICIYHAEDFTGSYILTVRKMPPPPNDIELTDIYLDDECFLWIKFTNKGTEMINQGLRLNIWSNDVLIRDENVLFDNFQPGTVDDHGYTGEQGIKISGTAEIKAYVDADNELQETNETNNTLTKTVTCPIMECGPDPYEDNNTRSQATEIRTLFLGRPWKSKEGTEICPINDQDWFKLKASAGQTLNIFCDVTSSKLDAVIGLFMERMWRPLAVQNCQGIGGDEKLTYKCKSSGTYYVGIGSESVAIPRMIMKPGGTGSYKLTIEKSGWR